MIKTALFLFIFLIRISLFADLLTTETSEEKNIGFDLQGRAYFAAQNYSQATVLYRERLQTPVLSWQRNRLLYNLGTIELAQNNPEEALSYFQQITPEELSLPYLASNLSCNIAAAYLKTASTLTSSELDKQVFLIETALIFLKQAQKLNCADEKERTCSPSPMIAEQTELANTLLEQNQKSRLDEGLQKLSKQIEKNQSPLLKIKFDYDLLLLHLSPFLTDVKKLIEEIDLLKVNEDQQPILLQVKSLLSDSIKHLEANQNIAARFFLIASYDEFEKLIPQNKGASITILQHTLDHSIRTLQMIYFLQLLSESNAVDQKTLSTVIRQQKQTSRLVDPFIPTVLEQEAASYHQTDHPDEQCQESPWDQALPLFAQGLKKSRKVEKKLVEKKLTVTPLHPTSLIADQEGVVKAWQETLNLLINPPTSGQQQTNQANQSLNETFRLIQEMYMEDQAQPAPKVTGRHSW